MLFAVCWLPLVLAVGFGRSARAWTSDNGKVLPPDAPAPWSSDDTRNALLAKRSPSGEQGAESSSGPGEDATSEAPDAQTRQRIWPSEVDKLSQSSATIKGGGRMSWAVCMDNCLAPVSLRPGKLSPHRLTDKRPTTVLCCSWRKKSSSTIQNCWTGSGCCTGERVAYGCASAMT
jgi:hypothetical protein